MKERHRHKCVEDKTTGLCPHCMTKALHLVKEAELKELRRWAAEEAKELVTAFPPNKKTT